MLWPIMLLECFYAPAIILVFWLIMLSNNSQIILGKHRRNNQYFVSIVLTPSEIIS